jgi:micrococcal nuclease
MTMPSVLRFLALIALLFASVPSEAVELPTGLKPGGTGRVVEVVDGDTIRLADGREVRLVGIQAPKLPLGRPNFPTWPMAPEAKAALEELILRQEVVLGFGGRDHDRYGRLLPRVYTFADNRALAGDLLAREREARQARRGIWALDHYAILTPETANRALDQYALIEGRVVRAGEAHGAAYLNFGPDWKTDFTAVIRAPGLRVFAEEEIDVAAYQGRRIRVRGWVESWNGPMIEITHPEQIEEVME